jgi:FkbM family methyltransferase
MKHIRQKIKQIPFLGTYFIRIYKILFPDIHYLIERYLPSSDATILQIGSNDGKTGDPIFSLIKKYIKWKCIFVEPVPYLFNRLQNNYGTEPRFTFENVAINDGVEQTFYFVRNEAIEQFPDLPYWYDQLSSFIRSNITKHLNGILDPYIEEIKLEGITLSDLLEKNSINNIDLFHIDAEGYDWRILRQLPLNQLKPSIILYEHRHLGTKEKELSLAFLTSDYYIFFYSGDYLNIRKDLMKKVDLIRLRNRCLNGPHKIDLFKPFTDQSKHVK